MAARGRVATCLVAAFVASYGVANATDPSAPVTGASTLTGVVSDIDDGSVVVRATVEIDTSAGARIATTTSDARGAFAFDSLRPGRYVLIATARDYDATSQQIVVAFGRHANRVVERMMHTGRLREIGATASRSSGVAEAEPGADISAVTVAREGALRVAPILAQLPGVEVSGDSSSPGGDAYVSLRGLRPGESRTLLDGHPVGPVGVAANAPDSDGTVVGFNYQVAPTFALRAVDVGFEPTANALYGGASVGGTVDLRTYDPTRRPNVVVEQGLGAEGRATTSLRATGTEGKFGYAVVDGVQGTYGLFAGGAIAQTGLRGADFTSATLRALTYDVSGDYLVRNDLVKLTYAPAATTTIALTAYDATSWTDKTGEGDNDFNPARYTFANAPVGTSQSCPHGVAVTEDAGPACISAAAYAAAASGPAGGGPGAWQAIRNSDYDARAAIGLGRSNVVVDAFTDDYDLLYHRSASAVSGPLDAFLDTYSTYGFAVRDDIAGPKNALGFGIDAFRQTLAGDTTVVARTQTRAFVRDTYAPASHLSFSLAMGLDGSNVDPRNFLDSWASIVYRPDRSDALRFSAGTSIDAPSLQTDRVNLLPVGALNPDCGAIAHATTGSPATVAVGSGPAANLSSETASDLELSYERRFGAGAGMGITIYDTNVAHRIVTGEFPAGSQLPDAAVAPLFARIDGFCGLAPAPGAISFALDRAFNAASARLRGIEVNGHARVTKRVAIDYSYDVASVVLNALPDSVLATDPTLVDGLQVFGVPLHKANVGFEFAPASGIRIRLDGHAVGPGNLQQLPGYAYVDGSMSAAVARHLTVSLAASNLFGSHAQTYGLVGSGLPYATNAANASLAAPSVQPFNERYGLAPAALTVDATLHL